MKIELTGLEIILITLLCLFVSSFRKTDPTDKSFFQRSGMHYFKDYGTGIEYIAAPSEDGAPILVRREYSKECKK